MGAHTVNGQFQSDKYPTCPPGKVPLSVEDPTAQDLLWEYAQRRRWPGMSTLWTKKEHQRSYDD